MIYIVMGPPGDIMNNLDQQSWYYSLPGSMGTGAFTFRRQIIGEGENSMMTYSLYRSIQYEQLWLNILSRWRSCEGY